MQLWQQTAILRPPHPPNAPEWAYIEQSDQVYDTEIEGSSWLSKYRNERVFEERTLG